MILVICIYSSIQCRRCLHIDHSSLCAASAWQRIVVVQRPEKQTNHRSRLTWQRSRSGCARWRLSSGSRSVDERARNKRYYHWPLAKNNFLSNRSERLERTRTSTHQQLLSSEWYMQDGTQQWPDGSGWQSSSRAKRRGLASSRYFHSAYSQQWTPTSACICHRRKGGTYGFAGCWNWKIASRNLNGSTLINMLRENLSLFAWNHHLKTKRIHSKFLV